MYGTDSGDGPPADPSDEPPVETTVDSDPTESTESTDTTAPTESTESSNDSSSESAPGDSILERLVDRYREHPKRTVIQALGIQLLILVAGALAAGEDPEIVIRRIGLLLATRPEAVGAAIILLGTALFGKDYKDELKAISQVTVRLLKRKSSSNRTRTVGRTTRQTTSEQQSETSADRDSTTNTNPNTDANT